jgi:topoisomerase-4 subunit A
MAKTQKPVRTTPDVIDQPLSALLADKYLAYALSTIMSRSLPDVRDGLKPVHRRVLFAMSQLKLDPKDSPKKSARVVGDVIGKFHPHGDQSVYDALVRLAQDFSVRYPLVDGQGNFGNIDGDNAAAMRYTEARLTDTAVRLLAGIDENAIDFRATYDGDTMEPIVLPANFPNLLANGSSGIAVGMATNIPPHNVAEICDALSVMLDHEPTDKELLKCIPGPDFPTGGILIEPRENILAAYTTGRGSFRLRARWETEDIKGGGYQIIITEIPYQVQKSKLIEQIAAQILDKKLPLVDDINDQSAEDIRVVITPKSRNIDPALLMESLFRATDLEIKFALNMNVLENGVVPRVMPLRDVLRAYLDHRRVVLQRTSAYRLDKVTNRMEVLSGYLIVYLNIDKVIHIIRTEDEPKPKLMKAFGLTDNQAEAILNMRLRSLRKLEEMEIRREHDELAREKDGLEKLLSSEKRQWTAIGKEIDDLRVAYDPKSPLGKRRTKITAAPDVGALEQQLDDVLTVKEPITVICSDKGWIRAMKGHDVNTADLKYKEGDREKFIFPAMTTDKIIVMATNGRCYTIAADKLPSARGFGDPVKLMMEAGDADVVYMGVYDDTARYVVISTKGYGFAVAGAETLAQTKNGKVIMNVGDGAEMAACLPVPNGANHICMVATNRKMVVFPLDQVPDLAKGKGVILQKYADGAEFSDAQLFALKAGITFISGSKTVGVADMKPWLGARASVGKLPPNGFPRSNRFG